MLVCTLTFVLCGRFRLYEMQVPTRMDSKAHRGDFIIDMLEGLSVGDVYADDRDEMLAEYGLSEPGLNKVIREAYDLLGLLTYFTAGELEVRAWTVQQGSTAPQSAAAIHTDFEKGFIRAEVIGYEDYVAGRGEAGAKDAGKWRLEGKDYITQEGDVMHFRFNV